MDEADWLAGRFEEQRARLRAVAYCSTRAYYTGSVYTPLASITTWVTPRSRSPAAICWSTP